MSGLSPRDDARSLINHRAADVTRLVAKERRIGETVVGAHNEEVAYLLMLAAAWLDHVPQMRLDELVAEIRNDPSEDVPGDEATVSKDAYFELQNNFYGLKAHVADLERRLAECDAEPARFAVGYVMKSIEDYEKAPAGTEAYRRNNAGVIYRKSADGVWSSLSAATPRHLSSEGMSAVNRTVIYAPEAGQ